MNLTHLSEEELLSGVRSLSVQDRIIGAKLLAYLAEVEARGLHRDRACATLCQYCIRELGMSEDEAWRRASAASVVRAYPVAIGMLERGETSLTNLLLLKPYLKTPEDEELLLKSAKMSKLEVQELLASRFPRPDVPTSIAPVASEALPLVTPPSGPATAGASPPARSEPLSPARFRLEGTIDADVRDLLGEVRDLMSHSNPSGDLNVLLKYALTLAKKDLEKNRFAKTDRPRKSTKPSTATGSIPRATRRLVFERGGEGGASAPARGRSRHGARRARTRRIQDCGSEACARRRGRALPERRCRIDPDAPSRSDPRLELTCELDGSSRRAPRSRAL